MAKRTAAKSRTMGRNRASKSRAKSAKARSAKTKRARSTKQSRRTVANGEVKFKEVVGHVNTDVLQHNEGSALAGPGNSVIFLGGQFGGQPIEPTAGTDAVPGLTQGVGETNVLGNWYTPAYPDSMKLKIDYSSLADGSGYATNGVNVRVVTGFIKVTGNCANLSLTNPASFLQACYALARRELYESQFSASHLTFTKNSHLIQVLSDKKIKPGRSQLVSWERKTEATPVTATEVQNFCPPSLVHVRHPQKVTKRRLTPTTDTDSVALNSVVPYDEHIPFTMVMCEGLTGASGEGGITCSAVTKAWFRDA